MIAIDIRELSYLKLLQPICLYFLKHNMPYTIVHYGMHRGDKEYNRSSISNINKSNKDIIAGAKNTFSYNNHADLLKIIRQNNIKKFVSVEIYLSYAQIIKNLKNLKVRLYSLQYFTDSVWTAKSNYYDVVDAVYFSSNLLMKKSIDSAAAKFDPNRHKFLGSPLYDQLEDSGSENNILVMLPNIKADYVKSFFKSKDRFMSIIDGLSRKGNLIFKTRRKQWLPSELKKYSSDIIFDTECMYPSSICGALGRSNAVVIFYSSSIYECVMANKYVLNIETPLIYRNFNAKSLNCYYSKQDGSLYSFSGVVDTVSQDKIIDGDFTVRSVDKVRLSEWKDKFMKNCNYNSSELISKDILL